MFEIYVKRQHVSAKIKWLGGHKIHVLFHQIERIYRNK